MKRSDILKEVQKYFKLKELVCPHAIKKLGDKSWNILDARLLETLLVLRRDILKESMLINFSGKTQRGTRCNACEIVKSKKKAYLSAHTFGCAVDFNCVNMDAQEVRDKIADNEHLLPYPIRLEKDVGWVHIDVIDCFDGKKINYFRG